MPRRHFYSFLILLVFKLCSESARSEDKTHHHDLMRGISMNESEYCLTPACVLVAAMLLQNYDPKADPCDDFYSFACGGFINSNFIPDDEVKTSENNLLIQKVHNQVKSLVEAPMTENDTFAFNLTKIFYSNCMDEDSIDRFGLKSLENLFSKWGGWPVITSNWTADNFTWYKTMYTFRNVGVNTDGLIYTFVYTDLKNSSARILYIDQPSLGLSQSYFMLGLNDTVMQAYLKYMVDIAVALGATKESAESDMKDVLDFETKLAQISVPEELKQDLEVIYNKVTIKELSVNYSSIPWLEFINTMLYPFYNVTLNESVVVLTPSYFHNLTLLLTEVSNRTLSNYLGWRAVMSLVDYSISDLRSITQKFMKRATGQMSQPSRSKTCVTKLSDRMQASVGSLYIRRFFNEEDAKQTTGEIVRNIKGQFDRTLEEISWMDNITKMTAKNKSDAMTSNIGYPDELLNDTLLDELYEGLNFTHEYFLEIILQLNQYEKDKGFRSLKQPVSADWTELSGVAAVNAYYHRIRNAIILPAGILQGVYFNKDRPKYMLFGAIGYVVGHEIIHGFDLTGRQIDQYGNLRDWWENQTNQNYIERAQCFKEQYGSIVVPELNITLNGETTLNENIADNGGIRQAYRAYENWITTHGTEKKLPGLEYSPQQLMWMSFANILCSKERPQYLNNTIVSSEHSPDRYRVNVPLGNMQEFTRDWNCSSTSRMIPKRKCSIW